MSSAIYRSHKLLGSAICPTHKAHVTSAICPSKIRVSIAIYPSHKIISNLCSYQLVPSYHSPPP